MRSVNLFVRQIYAINLCALYKQKKESVRKYYKENFEGNVAVFDVGYSGKLPHIINELCEKRVDTFFIHSSAGAFKIAVENGFEIHDFLDFTPAVSGVVMEYFLSSQTFYRISLHFQYLLLHL